MKFCQNMERMGLSNSLHRKQPCFLQISWYKMMLQFTRLSRSQEILSSPFLERIMLDSVMVIYLSFNMRMLSLPNIEIKTYISLETDISCIGFNCGEAVNFALDDWFPLGAAASKRYANLKMFPLVSYEELLCKEAVHIYKSLKVRGSKNKPVKDLTSYHATVLSFMHLLQFYKETLLGLNDSKESSSTIGTLTCCDCHRECYLAYMLCEYCHSDPICLFHGKNKEKALYLHLTCNTVHYYLSLICYEEI